MLPKVSEGINEHFPVPLFGYAEQCGCRQNRRYLDDLAARCYAGGSRSAGPPETATIRHAERFHAFHAPPAPYARSQQVPSPGQGGGTRCRATPPGAPSLRATRSCRRRPPEQERESAALPRDRRYGSRSQPWNPIGCRRLGSVAPMKQGARQGAPSESARSSRHNHFLGQENRHPLVHDRSSIRDVAHRRRHRCHDSRDNAGTTFRDLQRDHRTNAVADQGARPERADKLLDSVGDRHGTHGGEICLVTRTSDARPVDHIHIPTHACE